MALWWAITIAVLLLETRGSYSDIPFLVIEHKYKYYQGSVVGWGDRNLLQNRKMRGRLANWTTAALLHQISNHSVLLYCVVLCWTMHQLEYSTQSLYCTVLYLYNTVMYPHACCTMHQMEHIVLCIILYCTLLYCTEPKQNLSHPRGKLRTYFKTGVSL